MPTRAQLVERYETANVDELQIVLSSDEYTDEAKDVVREQLLARGIAGPAMRGAGFPLTPVQPVRPFQNPLRGSFGKFISFVFGLQFVLVGLGVGCIAMLETLDSGRPTTWLGGSCALIAAGLMLLVRRRVFRLLGLGSVGFAMLTLGSNAVVRGDVTAWFPFVRAVPLAVILGAVLQLTRTREELASDSRSNPAE